MNNRLKRQERESVRSRYATSELLYKVMSGPARELECEMKIFRFSVEELFFYVFSILDNIKEYPEDALDGVVCNLWHTVYCDLRDMDVSDSPDEEIRLATTEVVCVVMILLSMCEGVVYGRLSFDLSIQLNEYSPETYIGFQARFMPAVWRLGEEKVRARIEEYMDSDEEWISDDIEETIEALVAIEQPRENKEKEKKSSALSNKQLIILFEHLLNVTPKTGYTNVKAFSKLIAEVSGHSAGSIRQTVIEGIDYESPSVHDDVDRIEALVRPISERLADCIKNSKE